jgi:hypothetical protein
VAVIWEGNTRTMTIARMTLAMRAARMGAGMRGGRQEARHGLLPSWWITQSGTNRSSTKNSLLNRGKHGFASIRGVDRGT